MLNDAKRHRNGSSFCQSDIFQVKRLARLIWGEFRGGRRRCEWWEKALNAGWVGVCRCVWGVGGWNYPIMIRKLEPLLRESKQASLSVKGLHSARSWSQGSFLPFTDPPLASRALLLFPEITEWIYGAAWVGVLLPVMSTVWNPAPWQYSHQPDFLLISPTNKMAFLHFHLPLTRLISRLMRLHKTSLAELLVTAFEVFLQVAPGRPSFLLLLFFFPSSIIVT